MNKEKDEDNMADSHIEHPSPKEKKDSKKRLEQDLKTIETKRQGDKQ